MAKRTNWAAAFDPANALDKRPSSWAVRYGDLEWKNFLDFWAHFVRVNGETERLMAHHVNVLSTTT